MPRRTDTASIVVPSPPDRVYQAFSTPQALMAWLPPQGMTGRALEYEFREGGTYRIELTYQASSGAGKTTDETDVSHGRFVKLEPGERIVQSVNFESEEDAWAGEMVMTWSFELLPEGTRITVTAENVPSGISAADHESGLRASLENLAQYLA